MGVSSGMPYSDYLKQRVLVHRGHDLSPRAIADALSRVRNEHHSPRHCKTASLLQENWLFIESDGEQPLSESNARREGGRVHANVEERRDHGCSTLGQPHN